MENNLIGIWRIDPADVSSLEMYGEVRMHFKENRELIYSIFVENNTEQIMFLNYRIEGDMLITDQPSHPKITCTKFFLEDDILELTLDGITSRYIRIVE